MTAFAPLTPQPAATRDGVGLDPLAGGFLPPYAERLDLISAFPALSAEAMGAALLDDGADAGGTRDDGAEPGGRAAGAPFNDNTPLQERSCGPAGAVPRGARYTPRKPPKEFRGLRPRCVWNRDQTDSDSRLREMG